MVFNVAKFADNPLDELAFVSMSDNLSTSNNEKFVIQLLMRIMHFAMSSRNVCIISKQVARECQGGQTEDEIKRLLSSCLQFLVVIFRNGFFFSFIGKSTWFPN